ncbi:MAG: bifunctional phosphoribosylaminoimidazolecarboxamide formyltransferase/IMP cyclohydrolase [Acidobacteria bacterium]|nr:bifunctional phosphoribosylaminoimidazolecarboxamide formyltransferase/IMP cyclohydrolase [Acidobacteriota bacterium]
MPRALLSVHDKSGIEEFARGLVACGWTIVSSGGTAATLVAAGIAVTDVADITGVPAILDHRVVTLHPKIHGGILADTSKPGHVADMAAHGIEAFDLVVVSLYPFSSKPGIELIDVGGPAMIRAAAKNFARVGVVVDVSQYAALLAEIRSSGALSDDTRRALAARAFTATRDYDSAIVEWITDGASRSVHLDRVDSLRYGENPHQQGSLWDVAGAPGWWRAARRLGGKEMSYLNVFDADAAWRLVNRFDSAAAVVVKHANPCGVATAATIHEAYVRAHGCDSVSAFGGIIALNRTVDAATAASINEVFTEVVVAPGFAPDALVALQSKKNLRIVEASVPAMVGPELRSVSGGLLVQDPDPVADEPSTWTVVSEKEPTTAQMELASFAWRVCASVSSNAITIANDFQAVGIGGGQQNRLDAARLACERAGERAIGGVAASDAFFPFRDGLDMLARAGVTVVVEPGGSVRDDEVIAAANEHGIVLIFTGMRHFRH